MTDNVPVDSTKHRASATLRRSPAPIILRSLLVAVAFLLHLPFSDETAHAQSSRFRVAVVKSLDLPEYNMAYEGFRKAVTEAGHDADVVTFFLERDPAAMEEVLRAIDKTAPDLILALGTKAAREMARHEKIIPIVYAMVLTMPDDSRKEPFLLPQDNLTGATLNLSMETQLEEILHVFPTARTIGVISDPSRTRTIATEARRLVEARGLTLRTAWAGGEPEVPNALRKLRDSVDVLWMLPDATIVTPRSSRFIIFELIKSGVPVVGLSAAYVKAGALMALDCDYEDIGRQSGELAVQILGGENPAALAQTAPRAFTRAINLKIQEHMKISINESVIEDSNVVIY